MRRVMRSLATPDPLTASSTWLAQSRQEVPSLSRMVSLAVLRCERVTRRATTQGPIRLRTPGLATQRDSFPTAKARPSAQSTPLLRDAQKPWGGHPPCVQAR